MMDIDNFSNLNINTLFKKAEHLYNNNKSTGFYISSKSVNGFHLGVYKPGDFYIWKDYVPENEKDVEKLTKSYFQGHIFKSFYCNACAITEPDGVIVKKNCKNDIVSKGITKTPTTYPKTENIARLLNYELQVNGIPFIICASAQQYYYNHLLFQSLDHRSSYIVFEDFHLFSAMFSVLDKITYDNINIKMIFNGNFGSNKWHFHTHITDQKIDYVDTFIIDYNYINNNNIYNKNGIYNDTIKFRVISSSNLFSLFEVVRVYSRYVYSSNDYIIGNHYLSAVFTVKYYNNETYYVAFIITGAKIPNVSGTNIRLILPSSIANITSFDTNTDIKQSMNIVKIFVKTNNLYIHLPDNPVIHNLPKDTTELMEFELMKSNRIWTKDDEKHLSYIGNIINNCTNTQCNANSTAAFSYIVSKYIVHYINERNINFNNSDDFVKAYRELYINQPGIRQLLVKFGFYHMNEVFGGTLDDTKFNYLKGTIGSILSKSQFENYFMLSSVDNTSIKHFLRESPSIKDWISTTHSIQLGEPSGCGTPISAGLLYDNKTTFVIKISKINASCTPLEEEFATGFKLNSLRDIIPNIVLTFGGFTCEKGQTSTSLCEVFGQPTTFLALEFVHGESLKKYIAKSNDDQILKCIYQILFALHFSQKYQKFTHYDLHEENIYVSPLETDVQYNYNLNMGNYTQECIFTTNINCTILDFGWARVDGINYKPRKQRVLGVDITFSEHRDVYTLIMGCFRTYLATKDINSIQDIYNRTSILGKLFGSIWDDYSGDVISNNVDCTYRSVIDKIMNFRNNNKNIDTKTSVNEVTKIFNTCAMGSNGYLIFLPHEHKLNNTTSIFANPLNLIRYLFNDLNENKIPTMNIYNWGEVPNKKHVGCDMRDVTKPKINLIDYIQAYTKKI